MSDNDNIMTMNEACAFTHISKGYMYKLCHFRQIPHYKRGRLFFLKSELTEWMLANPVPTIESLTNKLINNGNGKIK